MAWFFLAGLVAAILLLVAGSGLGFLVALGITFAVAMVWGIVRVMRGRREPEPLADTLEETQRPQSQFEESAVLIETPERGKMPEVGAHPAQTYHEVPAPAREAPQPTGAATAQIQKLRRQWGSLYSVLHEKISAGEIASPDVKNHLNQILFVSRELFPLLPDAQIDELQAKFNKLTGDLRARAAAQMAKGAAGKA